MSTTRETLDFQAQTRELLQLMIHSLYSHREIFLRELISNASDANDKLRFLALSQPELLGKDTDLAIWIDVDPAQGTLTVRDNGIGMSREEAISHLGTIAKSGTSEFFKRLTGDQQKDAQLIGQFGVGFYSAFIVAERVEVLTRRADAEASAAVRWESSADGHFSIEGINRAERGTSVILHLKQDAKEFLDTFHLRALVRPPTPITSLSRYACAKRERPLSTTRRLIRRRRFGPVRVPRSPMRSTAIFIVTSRTTAPILWLGATIASRASASTPACCTCPRGLRSTCGSVRRRAG